MGRLLVLLALVLSVSVADAHAVMRRPPPPPPPPQLTIRYVRTDGGLLARGDRGSIVRFLTSSTWDGPGGRIRFVDPRADHFSRPPGQMHDRPRTVMIRAIEPARGGILVEVEGRMLVMRSCRIGRAVQTCLEGGDAGFGGGSYGGF